MIYHAKDNFCTWKGFRYVHNVHMTLESQQHSTIDENLFDNAPTGNFVGHFLRSEETSNQETLLSDDTYTSLGQNNEGEFFYGRLDEIESSVI